VLQTEKAAGRCVSAATYSSKQVFQKMNLKIRMCFGNIGLMVTDETSTGGLAFRNLSALT